MKLKYLDLLPDEIYRHVIGYLFFPKQNIKKISHLSKCHICRKHHSSLTHLNCSYNNCPLIHHNSNGCCDDTLICEFCFDEFNYVIPFTMFCYIGHNQEDSIVINSETPRIKFSGGPRFSGSKKLVAKKTK
jgi:hypothetical protein